MTIAQALRAATERLSQTSDTARLDAELLMAHALGVTRSDMLLRHQSNRVPEGFPALVDRRATHEPVAYITGMQEFYGREFRVTPDVLIPRGDSETLIEAALELGARAVRVLDLGTGSGALLLTVLAENDSAAGVAVDRSSTAIDVAKANAAALGLDDRANFVVEDWREHGWADDLGAFDLILCNPPYVETNAELDPDVRDHEPASALFAGPEGLDDYRLIIPELRKLLNQDAIAIFEIGAFQALAVGEIAEKAGFVVEIRQDLANRPRALVLR